VIYAQLFARDSDPKAVKAGIVGSRVFSAPMVTQAQIVPRLDVPIVAGEEGIPWVLGQKSLARSRGRSSK
jgi:hypothetical protein